MAIAKDHYTLLGSICASLFCTPLMMAGVNAVLPEVGRSLNANAVELGLVGTIYALGLAVFQLACGSLGDIYGHRRLFLFGGLLFVISGFILGFVSYIPLFLGLRFFQGVGGALLSASGMALMASAATPENRTSYLGLSGAAVYAGIAFGPPVAGLITGALDWRWLFWISSLAMLVAFFLMKHTVSHEWRPASRQKYDWQGALLYGISMGSLALGAPEIMRHPLMGWSLLGIFALFMIFFLLREKGVAFPVLNLHLLARRHVLALSCVAAFVNYASFFGLIFYFSFYAQIAKGIGVRETGFILALQPLVQALSTPVGTRLCNIWSSGTVCALGAAFCGFGLFAAAFLQVDSPLAFLFVAQILLGCGISLFSLGNTDIILESAGRKNTGQASGLTGAVRTAGQLCSMIFITFSLSFFLGNHEIARETLPGFMRSMHINLFFFGALNLLAVGLALTRNRNQAQIKKNTNNNK